MIAFPKLNPTQTIPPTEELKKKIFVVKGWEKSNSVKKIDIANDLILCALGPDKVKIYKFDS